MNENVEKKNFKLVPPDGGWAYAICVASIVMMVPSGGIISSFGLMYSDLMDEIHMGTTLMVFMNGCSTMSLAMAGYLTRPILQVLSQRQLALIAAILFNMGAFSVAFANSITTFFICQTLLQNVGYGIMYLLAFTAIKDFFLKKRLLAISIVQTSIAIGSMCTPILVKLATDYYGYRGMLIIVACLTMQVFIGATLLQPIAWHLKKEEIPEESNTEMKTLLKDTEDAIDDKTNVAKPVDVESLSQDKKDLDDNVSKPNKTSRIKNILITIIDPKLLKEFLLSACCLIIGAAIYADFTSNIIVPRALYAEGQSREYVALAVSLLAFGDLATRVMFILFSTWLIKFESKQLHFFGTVVAFIARVGFLLSSNQTIVLIFLTLVGVGKGFVTVLLPVVIAEYVAPEKYSGALGLSMFVIATLYLTLGSITGAIRDYTGNYDLVFWIYAFIFLGIILLWVYELKIKKEKQKDDKETNKNNVGS